MAWLISFSLLLCISIATSKLHFGMVSVRSTQESWRKTYCVVYDPGWFEPTLSNAVVTYVSRKLIYITSLSCTSSVYMRKTNSYC